MFSWLKSDPAKVLKKRLAAKLEEARNVQRAGDVVKAGFLYEEAEALRAELDALEAKAASDASG